MTNSESLTRKFEQLGSIAFTEKSPSVITCEVIFHEPLAGIKKFIFTFNGTKTRFWKEPVFTKTVLNRDECSVSFAIEVSIFRSSFSRTCARIVENEINRQIKGDQTEKIAFDLLCAVAEIDPDVERPEYVKGLKKYDFIVSVRSARSHGSESIPVPINIKSGFMGQNEHIQHNPKIPSIMINESGWIHKITKTQELLHLYVNEGKILHI